jgi:group I intron endonuclease
MYYIYLITNKINGKEYVGRTCQPLAWRFAEHCRSKTALGKAIQWYSRESFTITAIAEAETFERSCVLEIRAIKVYGTMAPVGYNLTAGGEGIGVWSEEHRAKISKIMTGRHPTQEARAKMSQAARNRAPMSEETKQKLRDRVINFTPEQRYRMSLGGRGML